jgi:lysophospholipase L1-like esterase
MEAQKDGKTINDFGFISTPPISVAKPEDIVRIVFLGGSSTAGVRPTLTDKATWPWETIERLKEDVPERNLDFINAALAGYTSFESYGRFWSRVRFFAPDIAVIYHGWNEMYYFNRAEEMERWRVLEDGNWGVDRWSGQAIEVYAPLSIDHVIWPSQLLTHIRLSLSTPQISAGEVGVTMIGFQLTKSSMQRLREEHVPEELITALKPLKWKEFSEKAAFLDAVKEHIGDEHSVKYREIILKHAALRTVKKLATDYDPRGIEIWRTNLRLFKEAAKILGVELFVCKQATLIVQDLPLKEQIRCQYDLHGFDHDAHVRAFEHIYTVIDEEIPASHVIDVTGMSGIPEYFTDHIHLTKEGRSKVAEIVAKHLSTHSSILREGKNGESP